MSQYINYNFPRLTSLDQVQPLTRQTGNVRIDTGRVVTEEEIEIERLKLDVQRAKIRQKFKGRR